MLQIHIISNKSSLTLLFTRPNHIYSIIFLYNFSNFVPLLDTLALFFQIRDDYANLLSEEVGSELINRKQSFGYISLRMSNM